jgi:hypothetical protein
MSSRRENHVQISFTFLRRGSVCRSNPKGGSVKKTIEGGENAFGKFGGIAKGGGGSLKRGFVGFPPDFGRNAAIEFDLSF